MKISLLADYVKTLNQKACRTCSTIIFLHSTNQIIDLWRGRWCCRRQILNSLVSDLVKSTLLEKSTTFYLIDNLCGLVVLKVDKSLCTQNFSCPSVHFGSEPHVQWFSRLILYLGIEMEHYPVSPLYFYSAARRKFFVFPYPALPLLDLQKFPFKRDPSPCLFTYYIHF